MASLPSEPVRKRRLLPREARAASILRAAARMFGRGGYAGTSMDEIAAEAGVSKLMLYRHFNSKQELYEAILEQVRARLEAVEHRPGDLSGVSPEDGVREASATLLATIRAARELGDAYRLLYEHASHEPEFADRARAVRQRGDAKAERLVAPLIGDPAVRRWAARMVSGLVDEAVLAWLDTGEPERDAYAAERLAYVLGAMLGPLVDVRPDSRS
jgi:AcrR family transcriptional regulator